MTVRVYALAALSTAPEGAMEPQRKEVIRIAHFPTSAEVLRARESVKRAGDRR